MKLATASGTNIICLTTKHVSLSVADGIKVHLVDSLRNSLSK